MAAAVQDTPTESIAEPLLAFLRAELGDCSYADPPVPLIAGNETLVCAFRLVGLAPPLDGALVLRLFAPGTPPDHVLGEAAIQNALVDQGFPAARVFASCADEKTLGGPFFVMERLPGTTYLADALELDRRGEPQLRPFAVVRHGLQMVFQMPRWLGRVDARIHELAGAPVREALEAAGVPWHARTVAGELDRVADRIDGAAADGLRNGLAWLRRERPRSDAPLVVCHGDMQPLNLLLRGRELSGVVDWSNALLAPAECEIGMTRAAFLTMPLPVPAPLRPAAGWIARTIAEGYTTAYRRARALPLDRELLPYYEAFECMRILSEAADRAARGEVKRDAYASPEALEQVRAHFARVTGRDIALSAG